MQKGNPLCIPHSFVLFESSGQLHMHKLLGMSIRV